MKTEYIKYFDNINKYAHWDDNLSEQKNKENGKIFFDSIDYLCETKDQEVLENLLDFFNKENERYGGICERLQNEISDNFSLDQILQALSKKVNTLSKNDFDVCAEMCMWFIWHNKFEEFRQMFNTVKPELAEKIIDGMANWDDDHEYDRELNTLREDMKTWEVKR